MQIMYQSGYENPVTFTGDKAGLATGTMMGCVSVIALYDLDQARYQIIGQHGAGGISSVNFIELVERGRIPNSPSTRFLVIWTTGENRVGWEILLLLKEMIAEKKLEGLGLCQFEVYTTPTANALVTPQGQVFQCDNRGRPAGPLQPVCQFILKFIGKLKDVFG